MKLFPRTYRLRSPILFRNIFKEADVVFLGKLIFRIKENGLFHPRLGISISKRWIKKAADRNYVKRVNRECFRQIYSQMGSVDIVVTLRGQWECLPKKAIYSHIKKQWVRLSSRFETA